MRRTQLGQREYRSQEYRAWCVLGVGDRAHCRGGRNRQGS